MTTICSSCDITGNWNRCCGSFVRMWCRLRGRAMWARWERTSPQDGDSAGGVVANQYPPVRAEADGGGCVVPSRRSGRESGGGGGAVEFSGVGAVLQNSSAAVCAQRGDDSSAGGGDGKALLSDVACRGHGGVTGRNFATGRMDGFDRLCGAAHDGEKCAGAGAAGTGSARQGISRFSFCRCWGRRGVRDGCGTICGRRSLTGVLTGPELARTFANFDMLAFPSETDTFGLVVLEAFASGVPAVVTDHGGPQFTVRQGKSGITLRATSMSSSPTRRG